MSCRIAGFRRLITSSCQARAMTVFSTAVLIGHSGGAGDSTCATAWPTRSMAEMPSGATMVDK
jgi:hypothetical protein